MKRILVTGGAGYIGSHTCVELLSAGYDIVVVDNLSNSNIEALRRVEEITGREVPFFLADIGDADEMRRLFEVWPDIAVVVHFAGLKAVGESWEKPLLYYQNNIAGTLNLCEAMQRAAVKRMVFSSSATVYGDPASVPITEDFPLQATNPYGRTKLFIEEILRDLVESDRLHRREQPWTATLLRYFNPVGAHESGRIGEDPHGIPNNLMPYITQVAVGKLPQLQVFGGDWPTRDGTGVRDYIHVVDLARAHVKAVEKQLENPPGRVYTYNLGTGEGYSVLEMVAAFERVTGRRIPYRIVDRRPGDVAECYADPSRAAEELGWRAEKGIDDMVRDAWRWQLQNPDGYPDS
ncbi:UDP-glucose 4-epimerase [Methylomarinovum caldicuralii]|uniref:UDP-glucose 4-epimerase n=1 Tax=Methylomarinovum caldicuralii TaxID=438856 RepID=A0AAU9BSX2_9GAMM|nr:UDP-glucose 4-epimerase GalE [Methylomarinovum caldicuralii]BCX81686.1 UDP-glucose 4-epimerase [Methylomarinovum caldicuralii]